MPVEDYTEPVSNMIVYINLTKMIYHKLYSHLFNKIILIIDLFLFIPCAHMSCNKQDNTNYIVKNFIKSYFDIPSPSIDQYGNPVTIRDGNRIDYKTRLPYEIWLKQPRIEFILIPPGEFIMGTTDLSINGSNSERPIHSVKFNKPFYIGKYEVTQAQWQYVMNNNPSYFINAGGNAPVEQISWLDIKDFLAALNDMNKGLDLCTDIRLPSEAEWEYACKAGKLTETFYYKWNMGEDDNLKALDLIAWFRGNSEAKYISDVGTDKWTDSKYKYEFAGTQVVGKKKPNDWNGYDMIGNVWEWCEDSWHPNYNNAPMDGSAWINGGVNNIKVTRGGAWDTLAHACRSSNRINCSQKTSTYFIGFRLAFSSIKIPID